MKLDVVYGFYCVDFVTTVAEEKGEGGASGVRDRYLA